MTSTGWIWPVGKEAGRRGRTEKLCGVGKSEEMDFRAQKKLINEKEEVVRKGEME